MSNWRVCWVNPVLDALCHGRRNFTKLFRSQFVRQNNPNCIRRGNDRIQLQLLLPDNLHDVTQERLHGERPRRTVYALNGVNVLAPDDNVDSRRAHVLLMVAVGCGADLARGAIVVLAIDHWGSGLVVPAGAVELQSVGGRHGCIVVCGKRSRVQDLVGDLMKVYFLDGFCSAFGRGCRKKAERW